MEIETTAGERCCFLLKSSSGTTLFQSKEYPSQGAAKEALESLPGLLQHPGIIERRTDHQGKFHVVVKDLHGLPLGESLRYDSEAGMENGLKNILKAIRESM